MPHTFVLRDSGGRDNPIGAATTIGRDAACQIVLTGDPLVSRRHALLWAQDEAVYVRDENSSNGTFVNGQRLAPNAALQLREGDKLAVGETLFLLLSAEKPPKTVIAPRKAEAGSATLRPADPMAAALPPAAMPTATARRRPAWLIACAGVAVLAALVVCGAGAVVLYSARGPALLAGLPGVATPGAATAGAVTPGSGTPGPATPGPATAGPGTVPATNAGTPAQVLATSAPAPLLTGQQYAASSQDLASAVAALNQAELDFVRAANSSGLAAPAILARPFFLLFQAGDLDAKLRSVAAGAFRTASLASQLSQTTASQGGGSDAAQQTASQYGGIARLSAALVIEAQNARTGLAQGSLTPKAAAGTIAEYGARLWNPAASNPPAGNPFTPLLPASANVPPAQDLSPAAINQLTSQLGANLTAWVAASGATITRTLTVPPAAAGVSVPNDPTTLVKLGTADGQSDANAAYQLAGGILQTGSANLPSAPSAGGQVQAAMPASVAVTQPTTGTASLPAYPKGSGNVVIIGPNPQDTASTLLQFGSGGDVTPGEETAIAEPKPLVNLTISNINITQVIKKNPGESRTFEAEVIYEFDVQWTSNLTSPQFEMDCVGGSHFDITSAGGTKHIQAKGLLILYPGAEDVYCYASHNGNSWGNASTRFLVGDSDGATQRAIQVETDSVALNLTLTADAVGTDQAATSNAAASQAVLGTQNALETEVAAEHTQEFAATITAIAHLTEIAVPVATEVPTATPTFAPVFLEELFHAGNVFAVSTTHALQPGRLYRFCFSGQVNLTNPDRSVLASELDHVNGVKVPASGCMVVEGNGKVATISCGEGEPAEDPGGFTIQVFDLGPT